MSKSGLSSSILLPEGCADLYTFSRLHTCTILYWNTQQELNKR